MLGFAEVVQCECTKRVHKTPLRLPLYTCIYLDTKSHWPRLFGEQLGARKASLLLKCHLPLIKHCNFFFEACCCGIRDLDEIEDRCKRLELALRGVFAGNVFDLGAQGTADMFENGEVCSFTDPFPPLSSPEVLIQRPSPCPPSW